MWLRGWPTPPRAPLIYLPTIKVTTIVIIAASKTAGLIYFHPIGDDRGWLTPLEENKEIPFSVKRVYVIHGTRPDISRGFHSHRDLEQVAICVAGHCTFVIDDGQRREKFLLDSPNQGLHIKSMTWREMHHFSPDCVLVILANRIYDPSDYVRNYAEFKRLVQGAEA
jgi:dTDP-4-dehydrorhamnose 3,5-epimerase-like enzyme